MNLIDWAEKEIELACSSEDQDEYGRACYESALKAFRSLYEDGHSSFSIEFTKHILNRLIDGKPLTPIADTDDVWHEVWFNSDKSTYQCSRMSSLFKDVYRDGTIRVHDNDRIVCVDIDNMNTSAPHHNGFVSNIIDDMFPITMPYTPSDKPFIVYCESFLTDPKNGDYDTKGVIYVKKSDGERVDVLRYFKENEVGSDPAFVEISESEYIDRKMKHRDRIKKQKKTLEGDIVWPLAKTMTIKKK